MLTITLTSTHDRKQLRHSNEVNVTIISACAYRILSFTSDDHLAYRSIEISCMPDFPYKFKVFRGASSSPSPSSSTSLRPMSPSPRVCFLALPSVEVLQFLELHAAVQLLNTCRALRRDRVLSTSVLLRAPCAQHFLEGCAADWWHATPLWKTSVAVGELAVDEADSDWEDEQLLAGQADDCHLLSNMTTPHLPTGDRRRRCSSHWERAVRALPQCQHMALLALVDFVLQRVLPQCYIPFKYASAVYMARPVLLAIPASAAGPAVSTDTSSREAHSHSNGGGESDADTTRIRSHSEVRRALDALQSGFGADFAGDDVFTSLFGVHWDNMEVEPLTGVVRCRTCELYVREVKQYQDRVEAMIAEWKHAVREQLPRWKAQGLHQMEIDKRTYEMREEMIPYSGFHNSNIARRHGDIIIQHVCAHWESLEHLDIDTLGCKDASQLLLAMTADIRKQCHHFTKLKLAMAQAFPAVRRMQYKLGDPWAYLNMWQEEITTELVAGVSRAGFLCGFLLVEKGE